MTALAVAHHAQQAQQGGNGLTIIALIIGGIILKRAFSHGKWNR